MKQILLFIFLIAISISQIAAIEIINNDKLKSFEVTDGEIVVEFDNLSMKRITEFDTAIASIEGMKNSGFCQKLNCYYFSYDKNVFKSDSDAFDALVLKTKEYLPVFKDGTTSQMVNRACQNL